MATVEVEIEPQLTASPPTPNFSLHRVGSVFTDEKEEADIDDTFYVLGSIGRLCNEVDDITLESSSTRTAPSSNSPEIKPLQRVPTAYDRDTPVFSWESRTSTGGTSIDDLLQKRRNPGSSLAPQSSSDPSDDERSEAPSVGQFRPGTDLIQCPVEGCERTFKWKKNLHHHIRDKHPTDAAGLSVMRVQPAHVGAAHNGFRLQSIAIAPPPVNAMPLPGVDPSLRCPECGKTFSRKGDLVHHKRYHTRSTDRPYKCDQCGQGFIHHKDLARHMPRHTGQRSFQCPFPECHKNYTRKDNLNRHMRHDHGGLNVSGEVWTGVEAMTGSEVLAVAPQPAPQMQMHMPMSQHQSPPAPHLQGHEMAYDHSAPSIQVSSHLASIAEAASNHALLQEPNVQSHHLPPYPTYPEANLPPPQQHLSPHLHQNPTPPGLPHQSDSKMDSSSSSSSVPTPAQPQTNMFNRETTPSLGKRPAEPITDLERLGLKPKRKPKEKWAHRLGCPFRKCRGDMFSTEHGYRVCETTPHEFIIRLIEHMKRNHELYVCGECFLGFRSGEGLASHKGSVHHCGKCYLSFREEGEFIDHANTCVAVDAATQEDIWQILYETLCGDGVRHNPNFDDDEVNEDGEGSVRPSNKRRMDILHVRELAMGQVPSLARQLADAKSTPSGNATAPPVVRRADGRNGPWLAPVGAWSPNAPGRGDPSPILTKMSLPPLNDATELVSTAQSSLMAVQALQASLAVERVRRVEAERRAEELVGRRRVEIARRVAGRLGDAVRMRREGEAQRIDLGQKGRDLPLFTGYTLPSCEEGIPAIAVSTAQPRVYAPAPLDCPSLVSDESLPSIDDFVVPPNLLEGPSTDLSHEEPFTKLLLENDLFTWNDASHPWDCQSCGAQLYDASAVFCRTCAGLALP